MLNRIKMRHLQCFVEVVRYGSVTRAADALALTQPAVSKALKELEAEVGGVLLHRSRGGVSLTGLGEVFFRRASTSLSALRQGVDEVARTSEQGVRSVAFGAMQEVMTSLLPRAVMMFKQAHPMTRLRIEYNINAELLSRLRLGEIDFVIGRPVDPEQLEGLSFEPLYSEGVCFAVRPGHPLCQHGNAFDVKDVAAFPMHVPISGSGFNRIVERFLLANGVDRPRNIIESRYYPFVRDLALMTDTILISLQGVVHNDLRDGVMVELPVDTSAMISAVGLTSDPGVPVSPLSDALQGYVRAVAAEHFPSGLVA